METVAKKLFIIKDKIKQIAQQCERDLNAITLIAVSKTKPVALLTDAINAGHFSFGENYVQEAIEKIEYFKQKSPDLPLIWHFIGPLQSNKTKLVAQHFDWVHTIDRIKIAKRISEQRPANMENLNVLIQVNISEKATKSGILPHELTELAKQIDILPNLTLRGLMAIPEIGNNETEQLKVFCQMQDLFTQLHKDYPSIDTLSMGMSNDMKAAIMAGSTMLRIGTAIFGAR